MRKSFVIILLVLLSGCSAHSVLPPATPATSASRDKATSTTGQVASITPYQADVFVGSIGLNTHFASGGSWTTYFQKIKANLVAMGVRHVRDGWAGNVTSYTTEMQSLAASGIHADIITAYGESTATLQSEASAISPALEAYEAPNEYDCSGDPNWVADLQASVAALYSAVGGGSIPVVGPALCAAADYATLGSLVSDMDYGNIHDYMQGFNPGSAGWGGQFSTCGGIYNYGSIDFNLSCAEQVGGTLTFASTSAYAGAAPGYPFATYSTPGGSKPVVATENGQSVAPSTPGNVTTTTQAKYNSRMLLLSFAAGIPRTYLYEAADDGGCSYSSACYGMTDYTGSSFRPTYYTLKGLTSTLSDPGSSFSPTPIAYSISNAPYTIAQMLFQKRNGTYVLAVWNEAPSWNANSGIYGAPVTLSPSQITVNLPFAPQGVVDSAFTDAGTLTTQEPQISGDTITITVDDHVTLLQFNG